MPLFPREEKNKGAIVTEKKERVIVCFKSSLSLQKAFTATISFSFLSSDACGFSLEFLCVDGRRDVGCSRRISENKNVQCSLQGFRNIVTAGTMERVFLKSS